MATASSSLRAPTLGSFRKTVISSCDLAQDQVTHLRRPNPSRQKLHQIPPFEHDIRVPRLPRRSDRHLPLNKVELTHCSDTFKGGGDGGPNGSKIRLAVFGEKDRERGLVEEGGEWRCGGGRCGERVDFPAGQRRTAGREGEGVQSARRGEVGNSRRELVRLRLSKVGETY